MDERPDRREHPAFGVGLGPDPVPSFPAQARLPRAAVPRQLVLGAVLLGVLALLAVAAPWFTGDPNRLGLDQVLSPPAPEHWMGTDALGRDTAARVLRGGRVSLSVGLLSAGFALLIGLPAGALAGYRGGWADALVSRAVEAVLCFPTLLLVLAVLATAPAWLRSANDIVRVALVLGLTGWVPVARYLRAEFVKLRRSDMVLAARSLGGGHFRIAALHILPSALAPVLVTAAFTVGAAIGLEAALSFLGLGVRPPVPSWGGLLAEAREHVDRAWWLAVFPGIALFAALLSCNMIGEGLRDLLDPRSGTR